MTSHRLLSRFGTPGQGAPARPPTASPTRENASGGHLNLAGRTGLGPRNRVYVVENTGRPGVGFGGWAFVALSQIWREKSENTGVFPEEEVDDGKQGEFEWWPVGCGLVACAGGAVGEAGAAAGAG